MFIFPLSNRYSEVVSSKTVLRVCFDSGKLASMGGWYFRCTLEIWPVHSTNVNLGCLTSCSRATRPQGAHPDQNGQGMIRAQREGVGGFSRCRAKRNSELRTSAKSRGINIGAPPPRDSVCSARQAGRRPSDPCTALRRRRRAVERRAPRPGGRPPLRFAEWTCPRAAFRAAAGAVGGRTGPRRALISRGEGVAMRSPVFHAVVLPALCSARRLGRISPALSPSWTEANIAGVSTLSLNSARSESWQRTEKSKR